MTREFDAELGQITDQDRAYARELAEDIGVDDQLDSYDFDVIAQWLRKVRYEAVLADRNKTGTS